VTLDPREAALLEAFELHDPDRIRACLAAGTSATATIKGVLPLMSLIEMYTRSDRFAECLRVMLGAGASLGDVLLEALLLDDATTLATLLRNAPSVLDSRWNLSCAYTPLRGASALHVCAEYNRVHCARVLLAAGHEIDATADCDAHGFGGQTPLFHTVNSNRNYCRPMLELLVDAGADLDVRLKGLIWGQGFEWETTIVDVSPITYAQCGNYFQFHRREADVYQNLGLLYQKKYGRSLHAPNVPNVYLGETATNPPRM
jgi:hypothetical protein